MQFRCDVYAYDDMSGGVTVHVATQWCPVPSPEIPWCGDALAWLWYRKAWKQWQELPYLPHQRRYAGEMRSGLSYREAAAWLEELRGLGYRVPQSAINELSENANG
jgi:hypothetical protein